MDGACGRICGESRVTFKSGNARAELEGRFDTHGGSCKDEPCPLLHSSGPKGSGKADPETFNPQRILARANIRREPSSEAFEAAKF